MNRPRKIPALGLMLLAVFAGGLAGCAEVAPWERGILAKPHMALDPSPMHSTLRGHQYGSREASSGGGGGGGGGCGCN